MFLQVYAKAMSCILQVLVDIKQICISLVSIWSCGLMHVIIKNYVAVYLQLLMLRS